MLVGIYNRYLWDRQPSLKVTIDHNQKLINQREYLETCVSTLKNKFVNNMKVHKQDNRKIMKENVDLIDSINDLKREKKQKEIQRMVNL